jgi:hypothetical protein
MVAAHHPPPHHLVPAPPARVARHSAVAKRLRIDRVVVKPDDGRGSGTPIVAAVAEPART